MSHNAKQLISSISRLDCNNSESQLYLVLVINLGFKQLCLPLCVLSSYVMKKFHSISSSSGLLLFSQVFHVWWLAILCRYIWSVSFDLLISHYNIHIGAQACSCWNLMSDPYYVVLPVVKPRTPESNVPPVYLRFVTFYLFSMSLNCLLLSLVSYLLLGICLISSLVLCSHHPLTWALYFSQLTITMSVHRTESRYKNISTTIIRHKSSVESPLATSQSITAQVGIYHTRSCSKLACSFLCTSICLCICLLHSFLYLKLLTGAWSIKCRMRYSCYISIWWYSTFMSCLLGETNDDMDSLDLILPGWDIMQRQVWHLFNQWPLQLLRTVLPPFLLHRVLLNKFICKACIISTHAQAPFHWIQVSPFPSLFSALLLINFCLSVLN